MSIDDLLEKLARDPSYADRLQADPEETLRAAGIEPTPELLAAVKEGGTGEALADRISKRARYGG